jgi:hypothetical protein
MGCDGIARIIGFRNMSKIARALPFTLVAVLLTAGHMAAQAWTNFSSAEGRFSILLPAKAAAGTFDLQTGSIKVTAHAFTGLSQSIMVMCGYYDFPSPPQDPEKVFDETRDGSIRSVHGTLLTEEKLAKDGYSGRRFRSTGLGNAFVDEEVYLVGQRFYLITITTSTKTPSANIKKVFDSFHFTASQ